MSLLIRKNANYAHTVTKLDALGNEYHLVADSWMNGYTYYCYVILCEFYHVPHCSEVIFDNLLELLDTRYFNIY